MHEVLVNRLGGLSLPRKSVVRLTDRPDMTLDVYRGHKTTMQHNNSSIPWNCLFVQCRSNLVVSAKYQSVILLVSEQCLRCLLTRNFKQNTVTTPPPR